MRFLIRCLLFLVCSAALLAQWPEPWKHWRYAAPIDVGANGADRLISLPVPASVTTRVRRSWSDLRVIDGQGREVPFLLRAEFGGRSVNQRPVPLLEPTSAAGYRQAIADAGINPPVHNSLKLGINTDANLLAFVEIAVSSDLKDWRVVRDRAPIYVLVKEGRGVNTDVSYPDSASRYVRVRILDGTTTYTVASVTLGSTVSADADRIRVDATFVPSRSDGRTHQSIWVSAGDLSAFPVSAVEFKTKRLAFSRGVRLATSDDGDRWTAVESGNIHASTVEGAGAQLILETSEKYARRWRITVDDVNDAPVEDLEPALLTVPRRVVFRPEAGQTYRLLFGHPRALSPGYDLSQLTDPRMLERAAPATLGALEQNSTWVDPTPWTERNGAVLWTAMAIAAILLGVAAARTLRAPSTAASSPRDMAETSS